MKTTTMASMWLLSLLLFLPGGLQAETYFAEDFERPDAPVPQCWWSAPNQGTGKACLTGEKVFSGKRSALIEAPYSYWEVVLPKPLKWDRQDPAGIGNRPLYLSMRVFAPSAPAIGAAGFRASTVPKRRPRSGGAPIGDWEQAGVGGRTNEWLHLCMDVGQYLSREELRGTLNPDHIVLESISFYVSAGPRFYIDDLRLSTERPADCSPPPPAPPKIDASQYFRRDPYLESKVWHGVFGGVGSLNDDIELHADTIRDLKRHYVNFVFGIDYRVTGPERRFRAVERVLDQAAGYDMLFLPSSYIGDRYTLAAQAWSREKLRDGMQGIVRRLKDKSHLLGWYLEEEMGVDRQQAALEQKRWVEEADPHHSVWTVFNAGPGVEVMGPAYAVVGADDYPIGGPNANPWAAPHRVAQARRTLKQPYLLTDQIFSGGCGWTVPTLGQWRLMVYGALAEGANGFFHFAYSTQPLYRQSGGERMTGCMVDPYGTPSAIHDEIERRLGPDLFSIGELLRTCHPAKVPSELRIECASVEDALERKIPAIALRRLVDAADAYEIMAIYSSDPVETQTGTLRTPAAWLDKRIVMDLSAHSADILTRSPIRIEGESIAVELAPGDARFLAVTRKAQAPGLVRRMQARRFEALRKMVEFDCRWLARVDVGAPYSAKEWDKLQRQADRGNPLKALRAALKREQQNQELLNTGSLAAVRRHLETVRACLSASDAAIGKWSVRQQDKPFPPEVEPGKSYCVTLDKLSELFVAYGDLVYREPPDRLLKLGAALAEVCERFRTLATQEASSVPPTKPCQLALAELKPLEAQLAELGWVRPPTNADFWKAE
ncbi:MAG: hypothetical protein PHR35_04200 [Kiritimatiellae bacterium]|nr:hypothetical protein [Kiritimatiellia bacterium]